MRLFDLKDPDDFHFAHASRRGTWSTAQPCKHCGAHGQERIRPLVMEWEPDSDRIADFTWTGSSTDPAVTESVVEALRMRFRGFEPGPVEMVQDPKLVRPTRITKRTKPRVWLPYEEPPLFDLWVVAWVHADLDLSTIKIVKQCNMCRRVVYEVSGIETWRSEWDATERVLRTTHVPRVPGQGFVVRRTDLKGADIFHIYEVPGPIVVTEPVKDFIEEKGFTNVAFAEVGDVAD
jgi:hypothetical protein